MIDDQALVTSIVDVLLGDVSPQTDQFALASLVNATNALGQELLVSSGDSARMQNWQIVAGFRAALQVRLAEITGLCSTARARGEAVPDDPNPKLNSLNEGRMIFEPLPPGSIPLGLADSIRTLNSMVLDPTRGGPIIAPPKPSAQLASYEISIDGISRQSGDPLIDILGFQPSPDLIRAKGAIASQLTLDFSKRKPYFLFTSDFVRNGFRTGATVVCWQRMWDASGYVIRKRDVFGMKDFPEMTFSTAALLQSTADLMGNDDFVQVISFYDWISPGDFLAFIDPTSPSDTVIQYSIVGLQARAPSATAIFDVPSSPLHLSPGQVQAVTDAIAAEATQFSANPLTVSPYPALTSVIYGDPSLGWVIAGCNVLASQRRNESDQQLRSAAFIGATPQNILNAISAGAIVVPNSMTQIQDTVEGAISAFGISQAVLSILNGTGITAYITGKNDPLGSQPTQESLDKAEGGLVRILSAIDPQTALADPATLISSMTVKAAAVRLYFPASLELVNGSLVSTGIQTPPSPIDSIGPDPIDLTTFQGISRFVTAIRTLYDYFSGLVSSGTNGDTTLV